jgi:hypothetical protein
MAGSGIGGDFGPANDVEARRGDGLIGQMFYTDRPGLQVLETDTNATFMNVNLVGQVKRNLDDFLAGPLHAELEKLYVPQSDSHELAYSLVHAAHFESNPETVHVLLVTALEAVIGDRQQPRAKPVLEILNEFKAAVKQRFSKDDADRQTLLNALGNAKRESINGCGQRLAAELLSKDYGGEPPGIFFKSVYDQRNAIVHGHSPPPDGDRPSGEELVARRAVLFEFVLDILAADPARGHDD